MRGFQIGGIVFVAVVLAVIFGSFKGWGNSAAPSAPAVAPATVAADYVTAYKRRGAFREDAIRKVRITSPEVIDALVKLGLSDPVVVELLRVSHNPQALELAREQLSSPLATVATDATNAFAVLSGEKDHEELTALGLRTDKTEAGLASFRTEVTAATDTAKSALEVAKAARKGVEEALKTANEAAGAVKSLRADLETAKTRHDSDNSKLLDETKALESKIRQEAKQREKLRLAVESLGREMKFSEKYDELQAQITALKTGLETIRLEKGELQKSVGYLQWLVQAHEATIARLTGELTASLANAAWLRRQVEAANERAAKASATAGVIYTPVPLPIVYECPPPFIGFPGRRRR